MKIQVNKGPLGAWAVVWSIMGGIVTMIAWIPSAFSDNQTAPNRPWSSALAITLVWGVPLLMAGVHHLLIEHNASQYLPITIHRARKITDPKLIALVESYERGQL